MNVDALHQLLEQTKYNIQETDFILNGFRCGFDLGYEGNRKVKMKSPNLKLDGVGNPTMLWNKVMKEVKVKRYAGPYPEVPFEYYIQSPIRLVPKDENDTRLIFHLSYPRGKGKSINQNTPPEKCSVKYPAFDEAIRLCVIAGTNCSIAHSDMRSAFRNLGIRPLD